MDEFLQSLEKDCRRVPVILAWVLIVIASAAWLPTLMITPIFLRLILPLLLLGVGTWLVGQMRLPLEQRVRRLLRQDRFEQAFRLALRSRQPGLIRDYLEKDLELPSACLRARVVSVYTELQVLHSSVHDRTNVFVDEGLKTAMQESATEARQAFWAICTNLLVVARQKVRFAEDHPKIQRLERLLEQLAESTGMARIKLAELSLGANEREVQEAKEAIENVRRQSEALLEVDELLD